jgi:hypothetical protein
MTAYLYAQHETGVRAMTQQAFVISLFLDGERRASDCYGDFVATRSEAHEIGKRCLADSGALESLDWAVRYTVRRIALPNDFGKL